MAEDVAELLCPMCVARPQATPDGFCRRCSGERATERYLEKKNVIVGKRNTHWRAWTASQASPVLRERQAAHRLEKTVQPKERPAPGTDPWVLAANALRHLNRVRQSLGAKWSVQMAALSDLDEAMELVRQLAVGPED